MKVWSLAYKVIDSSDIIIEVLDARFIKLSRNEKIESDIKIKKKKLLYVINKSDLLDDEFVNNYQHEIKPSFYISSIKKTGITFLKRKIIGYAAEFRYKKEIIVGVIGYPNTGKSSVINSLSGRKAAGVSSVSGFTQAIKKIRMAKNIYLLDTPGVIPYSSKDSITPALFGAVDIAKIENKDAVVNYIFQNYPGLIEELFGISESGDFDTKIEEIAKKMNFLRKSAKPDTKRALDYIITLWQTGKIKIKH